MPVRVVRTNAQQAIALRTALGVQRIVEKIRDDSSPHVRVLTGHTRRSAFAITYLDGQLVLGRTVDDNGEMVGAQKPPAEGVAGFVGYSFVLRWQEFGTVRQPARPALVPAALGAKNYGSRILREEYDKLEHAS